MSVESFTLALLEIGDFDRTRMKANASYLYVYYYAIISYAFVLYLSVLISKYRIAHNEETDRTVPFVHHSVCQK